MSTESGAAAPKCIAWKTYLPPTLRIVPKLVRWHGRGDDVVAKEFSAAFKSDVTHDQERTPAVRCSRHQKIQATKLGQELTQRVRNLRSAELVQQVGGVSE